MRRRGRPPHPDILTPREWEVLALLREGLSDQAIADHLGISTAGAKYHVSEILSKLGVFSRQEAAAWVPEERAPERRWIALPLAARVAGALVVVATVAGLAVLAAGLLLDSGEAQTEADLSALPEPNRQPTFTRDQVLILAAYSTPEDTRAVSAAWTTLGAAAKAAGIATDMPGIDLSEPVWLVTIVAVYDPCEVFSGCGPVPRSPNVRCHPLSLIIPDGDVYPTGLSEGPDSDGCPPADQVSRDVALMLATRDGEVGLRERLPESVDVREMSAQEARNELPSHAGPPADPEARVWLVRMTGYLYLEATASPEATSCQEVMVVIDVSTRSRTASLPIASGACAHATDLDERQATEVARVVSAGLMDATEPQSISLIKPVQTFWVVTFTGPFLPPLVKLDSSPPAYGYCAEVVAVVYARNSPDNRAWYRPSAACN